MKKMIIVLLISLLFVALFSSNAFAEEFDPTEETPRDAQVGWGVFSLPEELRPQSSAPSGWTDPTDNPHAPAAGHFSQPDTIWNDYPAASEKSPEEAENEIMERCGENGPLPLLNIAPIPYIPIGEIDTNYYQ